MSADKDLLVNAVEIQQDSSSSSTDDKKARFEGVITSTTMTTHYCQFSEKSLKKMAREARKGVPVLPEHNQGGQPIGQTTSGTYDENSELLTSKFYIQRGLKLRPGFNGGGYADSDSYADAMQAGTSKNLSIGARVKDETCNHCDTQMKRFSFFGMVFASCENGHYPGQTIYVDRKGKEYSSPERGRKKVLITSTINDAELLELSSVTFRANPDAEVLEELQTAFDKGELKKWQLNQLADVHSIHCHNNKIVILPTGGNKMSTPNADPTTTTSTPETETTPVPQDLLQAHTAQIARLEGELFAKDQELNELQGLEEKYEEVQSENIELQRKLKEFQDQKDFLDKQSAKIAKYEAECAAARDAAVRQFVRDRGLKLRPGEEDAKREALNRIDDLDQIKHWESIHRKNARLNEGFYSPEPIRTDQGNPAIRANYDPTDYV